MILTSITAYKYLYDSKYHSEFRDYVQITLEDKIIETDSTRHFIYLGSKYAIFFNDTTELYPMNEVKKIYLKKDAITNDTTFYKNRVIPVD